MSLDHLCETKWSQNDVTWSLVSQSGLVEQKISRTPNSKFINFWYLRCVLPKRFKEINVTVTRLIFSTDFATSRNNSPLRSFFNNKITHNSSNHVHWIGMLILRFSQHHHLPSLPYISTRGVFVISDLFFLLYYRTYLLNPKHFNPIDHLQLRIISNTPRWKNIRPWHKNEATQFDWSMFQCIICLSSGRFGNHVNVVALGAGVLFFTSLAHSWL